MTGRGMSKRNGMTITELLQVDTVTAGEIAARDLATGEGTPEYLAWCARQCAA